MIPIFLLKENQLLHILVVMSFLSVLSPNTFLQNKLSKQLQSNPGKFVGVTIFLPEQRQFDAFDQGGLWKVNEDAIVIFNVTEAYFLSSTKKLQK